MASREPEDLILKGIHLKVLGKSDQEVYQMYRLLGLSEFESRALTMQVIDRYKREADALAYVNLPFNWSNQAVLSFVLAILVVLFFVALIDPFTFIKHKAFLAVLSSALFYVAALRGFVKLRTPPEYDPETETRNLGRYRDWKWVILPAVIFMFVTLKVGEFRAQQTFYKEAFLTIGSITNGTARVYDNSPISGNTESHPLFQRYASSKTDIFIHFKDSNGKEVDLKGIASTSFFATSYIGRTVAIAYLKDAKPELIILESAGDALLYKGPQSADYQLFSKDILEGKGAKPVFP